MKKSRLNVNGSLNKINWTGRIRCDMTEPYGSYLVEKHGGMLTSPQE